MTFEIYVINNGDFRDLITLSLSEIPKGWNTELEKDSVELDPGKSAIVKLTVIAPNNENFTKIAEIRVTGTSYGDESKRDSLTTLTTIKTDVQEKLVWIVKINTNKELYKEGNEYILGSMSADIGGDTVYNRLGNTADIIVAAGGNGALRYAVEKLDEKSVKTLGSILGVSNLQHRGLDSRLSDKITILILGGGGSIAVGMEEKLRGFLEETIPMTGFGGAGPPVLKAPTSMVTPESIFDEKSKKKAGSFKTSKKENGR